MAGAWVWVPSVTAAQATDLLSSATPLQDPTPPDDPYVQVKVVRDYGEVMFTTGKVRGRSRL